VTTALQNCLFVLGGAGKIKSSMLTEVLLSKARDWASRQHNTSPSSVDADDNLEGRGLYVFKHRERHCFQLVGRADNVFQRCSELLRTAFEGTSSDPLASLLVISLASDWDFYYVPLESTGQTLFLTPYLLMVRRSGPLRAGSRGVIPPPFNGL